MSIPAYLRSLAAKFFHRAELAGELEEELRSHIEHRADDLERSGLSRADAERQARLEFGDRERFKEESYAALGGVFSRACGRTCGLQRGFCASLRALYWPQSPHSRLRSEPTLWCSAS